MSPFSEDQFTKLWELTIRIDENTKAQTREFIKHAADDIASFALVERSTTAVHNRLDRVKEDLVVEKLAIKEELKTARTSSDKTLAFQNKLLGAILFATFVIPIVINLWLRKP